MSVTCLAALLRKISGQHDRRILSKLVDIIKKLPAAAFITETGMIQLKKALYCTDKIDATFCHIQNKDKFPEASR